MTSTNTECSLLEYHSHTGCASGRRCQILFQELLLTLARPLVPGGIFGSYIDACAQLSSPLRAAAARAPLGPTAPLAVGWAGGGKNPGEKSGTLDRTRKQKHRFPPLLNFGK